MFPKITSSFPHEKLNLYKILKPFYFLLSVFGLFPHSVKYIKRNNNFTIIPNSIYVNALCALFLILTIVGFFVAHVLYLIEHWYMNAMTNDKMAKINYAFELCTTNIVCATVFICAFQNRQRYVKILNAMAQLIQMTNEKRNSILGSLRFEINVVVMGTVSLIMILQICVNLTCEDNTWKMVLVTFTFNLPHQTQIICLAFYYTLIMVLVYVLTSIDETLQTLLKEKKIVKTNYITVNEKFDKPLLILNEMEIIYARAYEIKCEINAAFQAPILITALQCFHSIVSEAYIIYHATVVNLYNSRIIVKCTVWIAYQFLKIYSLARSGNLLKRKAMRIAQTLHNISTDLQEVKMLLEVQHFSSMVSYQSAVVTVYDFFPLDSTLMSEMIATATMYLIILVQFDKSNEAPHQPSTTQTTTTKTF